MPKKKLRKCPVCGHESWPIVYGMMGPDAWAKLPKETEFAGCVMVTESRENPVTGEIEFGTPQWQCQNEHCGNRWW